MALAKRIIPCLDVDNGRVVKGVHFAEVKDAGDPVEFAQKYIKQGADELVFLDITASQQGRETMINVVRNVASVIDIPFTVGGGIKRLEDARDILLNGADKVSINTAAVGNPELIYELMSIFGKQCVVVAIDAKRNYGKAGKNFFYDGVKNKKEFWFEVRIYGGKEGTGIDAIEWAKKVEYLGAGEILLATRIPIIASGGCGSPKHMLEVFEKADVDAALAASIFHYEKSTIDKVKKYLKKNGIKIRL
jgi:cyclase